MFCRFSFVVFYQINAYPVNNDIAESGLDRPGQGPWPTPESAENGKERGNGRGTGSAFPVSLAQALRLSGPIPPVPAGIAGHRLIPPLRAVQVSPSPVRSLQLAPLTPDWLRTVPKRLPLRETGER